MSADMVIHLPHGHRCLIDTADYPLVAGLTLYRGTNGYAYYSAWENGKSWPRTLHALLMGTHPGKHVDHINGDKLDNRRANLRIVTHSANGVNRHALNRNNTSGVRGVHWDKGCRKWLAQITHDRQNHYLGVFASLEDAIAARRAAEIAYFGESCHVPAS